MSTIPVIPKLTALCLCCYAVTMNALEKRIETLTADLPEADRAARADELMAQAEQILIALDAEERARAANTMIGLEQALRGEGMTIEEFRERMEKRLASRRT